MTDIFREKENRLEIIGACVFFAFLAALYFLDYFTSGKTLLSLNINPDFLANDYPLSSTVIALLKRGIFPLWNPFIMCGTPLFASSTVALSVFSLPHFLLPIPASYMACLLMQVFCAGLFMFLYLFKGIRLSWDASLLGGVMYMFGPLFLIMLPHYGGDAPSQVLLPLILLLFELCLQKRSLSYALFTALALAACVYSDTGYQYIYISFILFLYTLLRGGRKDIIVNLWFLFVAIATSFLLSAARILPIAEALGLSHRGNDHLQEGLFISNLIGMVFPFGPIRIGDVEIGTLKNAYIYYAGIGTIFLAFIGATLALKDRFARIFFCLIASLLLFLTLLRYTPIKIELSRVSSFLGTLALERLNLFYHFILVSLAAIGYAAIERKTAKKMALLLADRIIKWLIIFYSLAFILFVFFWVANGTLRHYLMSTFSNLFDRYHMGKFVYLYEQLFLPSFAMLVTLSLGLRLIVLYILRHLIKGAQVMMSIFAFFVALDLILVAWLFINPFSYDYYEIYQTDWREGAFLKTIKPTERVAVKINYYEPDFQHTGASVGYATENPDIGPYNLGLNYDIPIAFGASIAGGTDAMYPKRLAEFVEAAHKNDYANYQLRCRMNNGRHAIEFTSVNSRLVDLMGIKYVFSVKPLSESKLRLLFRGGEYYVYENTKVLSRVFFAEKLRIAANKEDALNIIRNSDFNPAHEVVLEEPVELSDMSGSSQAEIISYEPNKVVISAYSDTDSLLLLTDTYYPGWNAFVDSRPLKIYRGDYIFRGIIFPKGRHIVEFVYRPFMFILGAKISLVSLLAVLILIIRGFRKRKKVGLESAKYN